jgi:hypothetical protein
MQIPLFAMQMAARSRAERSELGGISQGGHQTLSSGRVAHGVFQHFAGDATLLQRAREAFDGIRSVNRLSRRRPSQM